MNLATGYYTGMALADRALAGMRPQAAAGGATFPLASNLGLLRLLGALILLAIPLRAQVEFYESKVRPVLASHCYSCHSSNAKSPFAGLVLDSRSGILRGGDHGPVIIPGKPAESRLLQAVRYERLQMPPTGKLPVEEIVAIEKWIEMGAPLPNEEALPGAGSGTTKKARDHWAWKPVRRDFGPEPSIDGFVQASLANNGLSPNPGADRRTLVRRVYVDLTGLAPSAEEIDAFVANSSARAYEQLVDRLLASPHFGERWARYWLDLARFSDAGFNNVRFPYAFTYRDWVIHAYNMDMPYDQFVVRQLAADQLGEGTTHLPALGFLSLGYNAPRITTVPDKVDDRIDTVSRTFLGLTVACARCHDHKYDPIPTRDYYSLYGVFANTYEPPAPALVDSTATISARDRFYLPKLSERIETLDNYKRQRIEEIRAEARQPEIVKKYLLAAWESRGMTNPQVDNLSKERNINLPILRRWRAWLSSPEGKGFAPDRVEEIVRALTASASLTKPEAPPTVPIEDFIHVLSEGDYNTTNYLRWQLDRIFADYAFRGSPARAMSVADNAKLEPAHVLIRGNPNDWGEEVPRQFLGVIVGEAQKPFEHGAGRLDMARAIVDLANPLTARVYVNRIWQRLFGEGIVGSPSDFGARGEPPSHPELLDYLAATFMSEGWSTKRLIRRIVLSEAYRRSASDHPVSRMKDPENKWLWRQNRRRLDFEALRDSMLVAAGRLDPAIGGPSFSLAAVPADPRRTMYAYVERERVQAQLTAFNYADPEQHTAERHLTTVPQQSLFLLNSPFVAEQARHVAARSHTVEEIYRNVLGRNSSLEELKLTQFAFPNSAPNASMTEPVWRYGFGHLDLEAGKVRSFTPFRYFVSGRWQASSLLPDREAGNAFLAADSGAPGDDLAHAVIRRWIAPMAGKVDVTGTLKRSLNQHQQRFKLTNGIRAQVVHSRMGILGKWSFGPPEESKEYKESLELKAETNLKDVEVRRGDTIDFVVDALGDYEDDNFSWAPVVRSGEKEWNAAKDFSGPEPERMSSRARLAQVLLLTNEFAFVD